MKTNLQWMVRLLSWSLILWGCNKTPSSPSFGGGGSLTREQNALIQAVKRTGAQSTNGRIIPFICDLSNQHVSYMIQQGSISHDGFSDRARIITENGGTKSGEIVASNCGVATMEAAANQCAQSWVNSPGHWKLMKDYWDGYCYAMNQGKDRCYYCIGLFGNGSFRTQ